MITRISESDIRSQRSSHTMYYTFKVSLIIVIKVLLMLLPFLIIAGTNVGRERCNGVQVLTSDGNERFQTISCLPNCTNQNCTWLKLPVSSDQQPPHGLILTWTPDDPKGQYICVEENNVTVEEVLIISEFGKCQYFCQ